MKTIWLITIVLGGLSTGAAGGGGIEQNGTYNMMGNVWEWLENGGISGGSYGDSENNLRSSSYTPNSLGAPLLEDSSLGFRVVAVPEPASAMMLVFGSVVGLAIHRVRRTALRQ